MHVSDDDSNKFCKFDEIWWTLKKCWNFMIFQRAGTVSIFLWNKSTSLKRLKFHMHVSDDDSNKYVLQVWWNLVNFEKMLKFHDISKGRHCQHFLWNKSTSLKRLKFHMHVSDDDSNKYVLQVWWNLMTFEKMLKFHDISRAGTVSIFLWKNITSLNWLKFHMHVSDDDSNKFCKFDEIWWTLKNVEISW